MIFTQQYVASMCESIEAMKITPKQKEFAKAIMRASIRLRQRKTWNARITKCKGRRPRFHAGTLIIERRD